MRSGLFLEIKYCNEITKKKDCTDDNVIGLFICLSRGDRTYLQSDFARHASDVNAQMLMSETARARAARPNEMRMIDQMMLREELSGAEKQTANIYANRF